MLQNTRGFRGHKFTARDDELGSVKDFLFDDKTWVIRYLVADTGRWLNGRTVLISSHAFNTLDRDKMSLSVKLTRKQIENSPPIDSHKPVSRQDEIDYCEYYDWSASWTGGALGGLGGPPLVVPVPRDSMEAHGQHPHCDERHLLSANEVTGYAIHASDGGIGAVSGLIVDDRIWAIRQLAVETGNWLSRMEVLISTANVDRISYEDSSVAVILTRGEIQHTAAHGVVRAAA